MASGSRTRGQRAGLTRSAVLGAASDLARSSGPDAISMRAVAARLGVAPNALYSHVVDKGELVDALLDARLDAIPVPDAHGDPRNEIIGCMLTTFDVLLDAPSLVPLYLSRHGSSGPRATQLGLALEDLLARRGVPAEQTRSVVRVLVLQTIGIAAQAVSDEGPIPVPEFRDLLAASVGWMIDGAASSRSAG